MVASQKLKSRVMKALDQEPMSLSELSRQLNLRREFLTGYLEALRHEGKVKIVTVGRSKVYRPKGG